MYLQLQQQHLLRTMGIHTHLTRTLLPLTGTTLPPIPHRHSSTSSRAERIRRPALLPTITHMVATLTHRPLGRMVPHRHMHRSSLHPRGRILGQQECRVAAVVQQGSPTTLILPTPTLNTHMGLILDTRPTLTRAFRPRTLPPLHPVELGALHPLQQQQVVTGSSKAAARVVQVWVVVQVILSSERATTRLDACSRCMLCCGSERHRWL
mmetsp:Transcript_14972/g.37351  ORF Transcript_14972/g.37351 Transcript_14972/m.37351 type:complete len:209 (+) Transcript_14972:159-785(+)